LKAIRLIVTLDVPPAKVWTELADLGSHPRWMADASGVEFITEQTEGVGTRLRVPTRIGPLRTTDLLTVIEWEEGRSLAVRHDGAVGGVGRFDIRPLDPGTELTWSEQLHFPWWLGGVIGAALARPILKRVWRANLERLGRRLEVSDP
jgi:carbon monoxide dehydrogenase subunit G